MLDFAAFQWREDDEEIIGHPRDPFHRVDIRASSLAVEVSLDGVTLASTNGAQLLYETLLPVRYCIRPADVRLDLMEESPQRTVCPYKGEARASSNGRIWAAGVVTGHREFIYVAASHGSLVVENAFNHTSREVDYRHLPE